MAKTKKTIAKKKARSKVPCSVAEYAEAEAVFSEEPKANGIDARVRRYRETWEEEYRRARARQYPPTIAREAADLYVFRLVAERSRIEVGLAIPDPSSREPFLASIDRGEREAEDSHRENIRRLYRGRDGGARPRRLLPIYEAVCPFFESAKAALDHPPRISALSPRSVQMRRVKGDAVAMSAYWHLVAVATAPLPPSDEERVANNAWEQAYDRALRELAKELKCEPHQVPRSKDDPRLPERIARYYQHPSDEQLRERKERCLPEGLRLEEWIERAANTANRTSELADEWTREYLGHRGLIAPKGRPARSKKQPI